MPDVKESLREQLNRLKKMREREEEAGKELARLRAIAAGTEPPPAEKPRTESR